MALPLLLAIPFLGALLVLVLPLRRASSMAGLALGTTVVGLGVLTALTLAWDPANPTIFHHPWFPQLALNVSLWLDGPALFWAWLVMGIGFLVVLYSAFYMDPADAPRRFYTSMLLFLGAMLGLVIARNLLVMFIFWELTSVTSFLLIGHWHHKPDAVAGARRALLVTGTGGLALLAGIALLAVAQSRLGMPVSLEWDDLWARRESIASHALAVPILVFLLLGVFTKSAQFPFHFWLPGAMEAPTPVSAFLHAATMVKAGIYLLGRMTPIFGDLDIWFILVAGIGVVTMLVGGYLALLAYDIKQLLAFSTVSQLGLLTAYYGFGHQRIATGDLLELDLMLVLSHALFKGGLFMLCGSVDHGTHTRDWRKLGGLWRKMPWTTWLTVAGCLSMAGIPLTLGFVAKKALFDAALTLPAPVQPWAAWIVTGAFVASVLTMAYSLRLAVLPFFGKPRDAQIVAHAHEGSIGLLAAPAILVGLCLASGLYVPLVSLPMSHLVESMFYSTESHYTIAFFKKIDFLFWVSMLTYFVAGPAVFAAGRWIERANERLGAPRPFEGGFDTLFDKTIPAFATWLASMTISPSLRRNTAIVLTVLLAGTTIPLLAKGWPSRTIPVWEPGHAIATSILVLVTVLCGLILQMRRTMVRVLAIGFIGLLVGGVFVLYKAPDLAITQILVELVILVMLILLVQRLGNINAPVPQWRSRAFKLALALPMGLLVGALTFLAANSPDRSVPVLPDARTHQHFFMANAKYPEMALQHSGGGTNVVNVILVDFRALDTLGEIIVLLVAALGVAAILRGRRGTAMLRHLPEEPGTNVYDPTSVQGSVISVVLAQFAPVLVFSVLVYAFVLFFSGHNTPGGGFIAGLMAAVGLTPFLWAGHAREDMLPRVAKPAILLPLGMLVALTAMMVPWAFGETVFRSAFTYVRLPLFGEVEVASALVFDLGVFLIVLGMILIVVKTFARGRSHA